MYYFMYLVIDAVEDMHSESDGSEYIPPSITTDTGKHIRLFSITTFMLSYPGTHYKSQNTFICQRHIIH